MLLDLVALYDFPAAATFLRTAGITAYARNSDVEVSVPWLVTHWKGSGTLVITGKNGCKEYAYDGKRITFVQHREEALELTSPLLLTRKGEVGIFYVQLKNKSWTLYRWTSVEEPYTLLRNALDAITKVSLLSSRLPTHQPCTGCANPRKTRAILSFD